MLHLILLHSTGSNNPLGINSNIDRIPFHIYFTIKDLIGFMIAVSIFIIITIYTPNYLSDPENFIEANPLITPNHIQDMCNLKTCFCTCSPQQPRCHCALICVSTMDIGPFIFELKYCSS